MKMQLLIFVAFATIKEMIDARAIERRSAANQPVDFVALLEQELRQVAAVLPRDSRDESDFGRFHYSDLLAVEKNPNAAHALPAFPQTRFFCSLI